MFFAAGNAGCCVSSFFLSVNFNFVAEHFIAVFAGDFFQQNVEFGGRKLFYPAAVCVYDMVVMPVSGAGFFINRVNPRSQSMLRVR